LEHLVEARRPDDLGRCHLAQLGDVGHGVVRDPAVLLLRQVQQRDQGRLLHRVAGEDLLGAPQVLRAEAGHQRSTSPMIGSTEEMTATASAMSPPCMRCGSVWRFTKLGPRMCIRYGLELPSETR